MSRRGENIYKRKDGRWEGRYIKGRKENNKPRYGYVYGRRYSEVKERLHYMKVTYEYQAFPGYDFQGKVSDWLSYWLTECVGPYIKESTFCSYQNKIQNHILRYLGGIKLTQLKTVHVQGFINYLSDKKLAPSSISVIFGILNSALSTAVHKRLLLINPAKNAKLPKRLAKEIKTLSLTEQRALETEALKEQGCSAIILGTHTGMRIGEISALQWKDIDFENRVIHVRNTLQRISVYNDEKQKTKVLIGSPKSRESYRKIPISPDLMQYLRKCAAKKEGSYVVSCHGKYAEPRVIHQRFKKTARYAGIANVTFHCTRHTFATRCLEQGVDIATISKLLGHASAKMTLDVYTSSMMEKREAAMVKLDNLKLFQAV